MQPFYHDDWLTVHQGDARAVMDSLPEQSVHMCMTSPPYFGLRSYLDDDDPAKAMEIGREQTPDEYVESLVEVFRSLKRVLRDDGTLWLNIGDSYTGSTTGSLGNKVALTGGQANQAAGLGRPSKMGFGLAAKQLIGVPWRVAFALQADGWYLRNAIVWATPNPMPESVTDRFTSSYEMVFLLAKSPKYFFDADAVREPHKPVTLNRIKYGLKHRHPADAGVAIPPVDTEEMGERFAHAGGRNKRDVWEIPTVPYPGAHYAVFPPALVEPCIKAGTSEKGVCAECGAPWRRITSKEFTGRTRERSGGGLGTAIRREPLGHKEVGGQFQEGAVYLTVGWEPTCDHNAAVVPAVVLDPFAGSGTVGRVAQDFSRRAVLIDLNVQYLEQQMARNANLPLGLAFESTGP